jgi:two-component system, chemotaxis family, chemotaxis protein CheY
MKVLVVDDDVVSRMVLMHLVDSCGSFEILEAEDGEDAWGQFQAGLRPRICFCDLRMPRLSGIDLLERVKADAGLAAMPFVLVSAAGDCESVQQAMALGADGYITKPLQAGQVQVQLEALADVLDPDESPAHTMRRLGIDAQRLALYLGGLHKQLVAAGDDIEQLLACADVGSARERIARLREGCQMLGLAAAAAALAALEARAPELSRVRLALERARRATLRQGERTRALGV